MYQALYRKWRPATFDEVVGQQQITDTLKAQVSSGHLSHAYLFIGSRGTGKTTCARILARAVNCQDPVGGNPCGKCAACRSILDGSAPEIVEIDAASNNGVDDVRALRDEAIYSPAVLKKRVYIIDEVHMLSKPAFNALLKILEEPPEHLLFVLATTELSRVPATILSRCQRFSFKRIPAGLIQKHLLYIASEEGLELTPAAAGILAGMAEGGMRDALSLLDQCASAPKIDEEYIYSCLGLAGNKATVDLLEDVFNGHAANAVGRFNELWMQGKDPAAVLREISQLIRDILLYRIIPPDGGGLVSGGFEPEVLKRYSNNRSTDELIALLQTLESRTAQMRESSDPKISAEMCLITLCDIRSQNSLYALKARMDKLESALEAGLPVQSRPGENNGSAQTAHNFSVEETQEQKSSFEAEKIVSETAETDTYPTGKEEKAESTVEEDPSDMGSAPEEETFNIDSAVREIAAVFPMGTRVIMTDPSAVKWQLDGDLLHIMVKSEFNRKSLSASDKKAKIESRFEQLYNKKIRVIVSDMPEERHSVRDIGELRKFDIVEFR